MARLQVLYLPDRQPEPEVYERRFGLVLDQLDGPLSDDERAELDNFAAAIGAAAALATLRSVDCDQGEGVDSEAMAEFVSDLREMIDHRAVETVQAALAQQQGPKLPPPDTAEGKAARTWGGSKPDPREGIVGWSEAPRE